MKISQEDKIHYLSNCLEILLDAYGKTDNGPRSSRSSGRPCAQSGGQAKKGTDQLERFCMKLLFSVQVCTG